MPLLDNLGSVIDPMAASAGRGLSAFRRGVGGRRPGRGYGPIPMPSPTPGGGPEWGSEGDTYSKDDVFQTGNEVERGPSLGTDPESGAPMSQGYPSSQDVTSGQDVSPSSPDYTARYLRMADPTNPARQQGQMSKGAKIAATVGGIAASVFRPTRGLSSYLMGLPYQSGQKYQQNLEQLREMGQTQRGQQQWEQNQQRLRMDEEDRVQRQKDTAELRRQTQDAATQAKIAGYEAKGFTDSPGPQTVVMPPLPSLADTAAPGSPAAPAAPGAPPPGPVPSTSSAPQGPPSAPPGPANIPPPFPVGAAPGGAQVPAPLPPRFTVAPPPGGVNIGGRTLIPPSKQDVEDAKKIAVNPVAKKYLIEKGFDVPDKALPDEAKGFQSAWELLQRQEQGAGAMKGALGDLYEAYKAKGIPDDQARASASADFLKNYGQTAENKRLALELQTEKLKTALNQPENSESMAQGIANYQIAPLAGFALSRPEGQAIMGRVRQLNPTYQAQKFHTFQRTENDATSGKIATQANALNTMMGHLQILNRAADSLQNGNVQALNALANSIGEQFGSDPITTYNTIVHRLGPEVTRAYVAGGGAAGERGTNEQDFDSKLGAGQIKGNIGVSALLADSKIKALQDQYRRGTYGMGQQQLITDEAEAARRALTSQTKLGGKFSVTDPNGLEHTFPTQVALDGFKKATGLK